MHLMGAITNLEDTKLTLVQSLEIMKNIISELTNIQGDKGSIIKTKITQLHQKNKGFQVMEQIGLIISGNNEIQLPENFNPCSVVNMKFNTTTVKDSHPINDTHPIQPDPHSPTYAQATSGRSAKNSTPSTAPDLNSTITNFLEDFKSLINPLISLLTKFLNSPLPVTHPVKHFTPNEVKYAIDKYPLKKSPGFDHITAEVARCLPKKAIIHLTHLFNSVLRLSYFPTLWKFSIVILVPKPNKPPDSISSYRPISLLPFFAKILERLLLKRILPDLTIHSILPNSQFGFRSTHSTIHQVHRVVDAISYALEKSFIALAFFLISLKRLIGSGTKGFFSN
ncbi:hypothetical protein QTP88_011896 [Uroleucon formosanum]